MNTRTSILRCLWLLLVLSQCAATASPVVADDVPLFKPGTVVQETNLLSSNTVEIVVPSLGADLGQSNVPTALPAATQSGVPEPGLMPTPGLTAAPPPETIDQAREFQEQLTFVRKLRGEKSLGLAAKALVALLETNAPIELKRPILFELALVAQEANQPVKAQQVFAQYLQRFPEDPTAPEILLRQGQLYRQMGVNALAISKFYAVMSTALKLKLDNIEYYRGLVLQAQVEIADTYFLEGRYEQAADYFGRLLKTGAPELDKPQIQFKLIRSLSNLTNHTETVAKAQVFLDVCTNSADVPEVRFLLASTLKKMGRNQESMKQVLQLLQSQQENVAKNPEAWIYWQRRAGNEIANQIYKEGDFLNALEIYLSLAELDKSAAWQLPVWYQTGLVYEQLQQWQKATDIYQRITARRKELAAADATPGLLSVFDMAAWRKDYIAWMEKAKITNLSFDREATNNPAPPPAVAR